MRMARVGDSRSLRAALDPVAPATVSAPSTWQSHRPPARVLLANAVADAPMVMTAG